LLLSSSDNRLSILTDELMKVTAALKDAWKEKEELLEKKTGMEEELRKLLLTVKRNKELILELERINREQEIDLQEIRQEKQKKHGRIPQDTQDNADGTMEDEKEERIRELIIKEQLQSEEIGRLKRDMAILEKEFEMIKFENDGNRKPDEKTLEPRLSSASLLEFIGKIDGLERLLTEKITENEQIRAKNEILLVENRRTNEMEEKLSFLSSELYGLTDSLQKKIEENITLQEKLRETQLKLKDFQIKLTNIPTMEEGCKQLLDYNEDLRRDLNSSAEKIRKKETLQGEYEQEILYLVGQAEELTNLLSQKKLENDSLLRKLSEMENESNLKESYRIKLDEITQELAELRTWKSLRIDVEALEKERKANERTDLLVLVEEVRRMEEDHKRLKEENIAMLERERILSIEAAAGKFAEDELRELRLEKTKMNAELQNLRGDSSIEKKNGLKEKIGVLLDELEKINEIVREKEEQESFYKEKIREIEQKLMNYGLLELRGLELEGQIVGYRENMLVWEADIRNKSEAIVYLKVKKKLPKFFI
jgi:hypothetical protein